MGQNLVLQEQAQRDEQEPNQHRSHALQTDHIRHSPATIALWTAATLLVPTGIIGFIAAISTSSAPADSIVGAAILFLAGVICGLIAWNRGPLPADVGSRLSSRPFTPSRAEWPPPRTDAAARTLRRRRHVKDPRVHAVVMAAVFAASIVALVLSVGPAEKSAYTQSHGVSDAAVISSFQNDQSCGRYSCSTSFTATANLTMPVGGNTSTTVQGNNSFPGYDGDQLVVLVDPRDPGYAELPGNERHSFGSVLILAAIVCGLGLLTISAVMRLLRNYPRLLPVRQPRGN